MLTLPVHGEHRHLVKHAKLGEITGLNKKNIFIAEIGDVLETDGKTAQICDKVTAGRVLVDGYGVGDVGSVVLRDRKHLGQDGIIIVVTAVDEMGNIISGPLVQGCLQNALRKNPGDHNGVKNLIRNRLGDYLYDTTKRKPMILPVLIEV